MNVRTGLVASLAAVFIVTGCTSAPPTAAPAVTVTVTSPPSVVTFNPATSGKALAARIATRVKPKTAKDKVTGVECRNFPDLKVGTHANCQMRVNGVKQGFRADFTLRTGHYVLKRQALTW